MDDRLPAGLEAAAFRRRAEVEGGHGTILQRGDPDRGAILLIVADRARHIACLERTLSPAGYQWTRVGPTEDASDSDVAEFVARRRRFDADSWILELDIPLPQRFIAELAPIG